MKTFHGVLFSPLDGGAGGSLAERVALLVALLRAPGNQQPLVALIKRCLLQVRPTQGAARAARQPQRCCKRARQHKQPSGRRLKMW